MAPIKAGKLDLVKTFNARLTTTVILIFISQFNFGFEQSGFSNTQAMDAFEKQFGVYIPKTKKYGFTPKWLSLFNSLPYISFGIGKTAPFVTSTSNSG